MTLKLRLNERKLGVHSSSSSSSKPAVGRRKEAETPTSLLQCSIYPATQPTSLKLDSNGQKSFVTHLTLFVTQLVIFPNISTSFSVCRFFPKPKDNQPYSPFDSFSLSVKSIFRLLMGLLCWTRPGWPPLQTHSLWPPSLPGSTRGRLKWSDLSLSCYDALQEIDVHK